MKQGEKQKEFNSLCPFSINQRLITNSFVDSPTESIIKVSFVRPTNVLSPLLVGRCCPDQIETNTTPISRSFRALSLKTREWNLGRYFLFIGIGLTFGWILGCHPTNHPVSACRERERTHGWLTCLDCVPRNWSNWPHGHLYRSTGYWLITIASLYSNATIWHSVSAVWASDEPTSRSSRRVICESPTSSTLSLPYMTVLGSRWRLRGLPL